MTVEKVEAGEIRPVSRVSTVRRATVGRRGSAVLIPRNTIVRVIVIARVMMLIMPVATRAIGRDGAVKNKCPGSG